MLYKNHNKAVIKDFYSSMKDATLLKISEFAEEIIKNLRCV